MVERLTREQIYKGMVLHGGPGPLVPIAKDVAPDDVLAEIEALDRSYEAAFKHDLEAKAVLEKVQELELQRKRPRR